MKTLIRIASTALFLAAPATQLNAVEAEKVPTEEAAVITSSISQPESEPLAATLDEPATFELAIAALVLESAGSAPEGDDRGAALHQAMRAFYSGPDAAPIWVDENGPTQKARDAVKEIRNADVYGLDPQAYDLPDIGSATARGALARFELAMTRAVLNYAHHAKAGRIRPGKVGHRGNIPESLDDPRGFLEGLASRSDIAASLRGLHPKHPQFAALQKKLAELRGEGDGVQRIQIPEGPALRLGVTHEQVALLRKRLGMDKPEDGESNRFDDALKAAVIAFQKQKGLKRDGVVGAGTRRALNGETNERQIVRILTNMERWRWLPDDLGGGTGIYVWTNIPEFRARVVKGGEIVYSERAIVGRREKQTPVFSDAMEWIEFHPIWYVPNSIKVSDIAPSLRRKNSKIVKQYHLKIDCGALGRDWKKVDWKNVDIRKCGVSQPPGPRSVLGFFKFKFPNDHIVYIHDTPDKKLFKTATRAYSAGCVRIENPRRMAEILLANDDGINSARIGQILDGPRRPYREKLKRFVPVHMTYFTAIVDDDGNFTTLPDVYGFDRRLAQALTGKGNLLPPPPAIASQQKRKRVVRRATAQETLWTDVLITAN